MEDRSGQVWAVAISFLIATWVTLFLRVWVRAKMLGSWGLDDWTMLLTQLLFTMYLSCQMGGLVYGTARHHRDLEPENVRKALRFWWFCEIFYVLTSCWLKQAVGVFLLRVAAKKPHILILRTMMIASAVFGTLYWLVVLLQCRPIHTFWTDSPGADTCLPSNIIVGLTYTAGCLNAFADWTFGLLPIFIVRDLRMSKKAKVLVAGLLAFAAVGSTATVVRIPFTGSLGHTDDFLWTTTDIAIWSTVEPGIGISAGCIATLRPLFQILLHKFGLSQSRTGSSMRLGSRRPDLQSPGLPRSRDLEGQFRPHNGTTGTVTTITSQKGGAAPQIGGSWEERIGGRGSEEEIVAGKGGIGKSVFVMYEEERRQSYVEGGEGSDTSDRWEIKHPRV